MNMYKININNYFNYKKFVITYDKYDFIINYKDLINKYIKINNKFLINFSHEKYYNFLKENIFDICHEDINNKKIILISTNNIFNQNIIIHVPMHKFILNINKCNQNEIIKYHKIITKNKIREKFIIEYNEIKNKQKNIITLFINTLNYYIKKKIIKEHFKKPKIITDNEYKIIINNIIQKENYIKEKKNIIKKWNEYLNIHFNLETKYI